jgi:hypothetical protein
MPTPPDVTFAGFGHGPFGGRPCGHGPYLTFPQWSGAPLPTYTADATDEPAVTTYGFGDRSEQRVRRTRSAGRTVSWGYPACGSAFACQVQSFFETTGQTRAFCVQDYTEGPTGPLGDPALQHFPTVVNAGPVFVARFAEPLSTVRDVGQRIGIPRLAFRRDRLYSLSEEQADDDYPPAYHWRCTDDAASTELHNKYATPGDIAPNHGVVRRGITLGVVGPDPRRPWDRCAEATSAWVQLSGGIFGTTAYMTACFRATWPPPDYDLQSLVTLYGTAGIWLQWQIDSFGILRAVGSGDNVYIAASAAPVTDNAWHFAVLRHDGSAGILHLTLDDTLVASGTSALALPPVTAIASGSLLGDDRNNRYFHGRAQDVTLRLNVFGGLEFPDLARERRYYGAWRSW